MKRIALDEGWQLAGTAPGAFTRPERLAAAALAWKPAQVPGTVAWSLDADAATGGDWDGRDWWYRATFAAPCVAPGSRVRLCFAGLATLAQVWLNGEMILDSRNMFRRHRVDVTARLRDVNQIAIRFASLAAACEAAPRRPRARWKTALAQPQELRHFRTTLLGRMPGWTPALAPVGPWRAITLEVHEGVEVAGVHISTTVQGETRRIAFHAELLPLAGRPDAAWLHVGDFAFPLGGLSRDRPGTDPGQTTGSAERNAQVRVHGEFEVPGAPLWWPHTHGTAALVPCRLAVLAGGVRHEVALGPVGFRALRVDETGGQVRFEVNGVPVFCRGASWTPLDARSLQAPRAELRRALEQARDAGANMLRVPGTLLYESDDFYRLCDELGLMVWQDFMFANFDYPFADAAFRAEALAEADDVLDRLHAHPCIAAYCGGSEVAQQAAMMGLPPAQWDDGFFTRELRGRCAERHPGIPYFPSTPWGGALPFHVGTGLAHYYGVGAYRRPIEDARLAQVKFAPECLAFAHVPEPETIEAFMPSAAPVHHPQWKARVPRDPGAGWDFEDVRDHYLRTLWNVDPAALRAEDPRRYLQLSRVASGEAMRRVYAEWRAPGSSCGGALAWLLRDLVPGAGWGLVDAHGLPKAAWWALARAWAPRAVLLTDRGLDGLAIHVLNDVAEPLEGTLELQLLRDGRPAMPGASCAVSVAAHDATTLSADALLGRFTDCTHAYRFGPATVDVVAARLRGRDGATLAEDFHFPLGPALARHAVPGVQSAVAWREDGGVELTIASPVFLQFVALACPGFTPSDNHFHVAPGVEKRVVLLPHRRDTAQLDATLEPLNATAPIAVRASREGSAPAPQRLGLRPVSP